MYLQQDKQINVKRYKSYLVKDKSNLLGFQIDLFDMIIFNKGFTFSDEIKETYPDIDNWEYLRGDIRDIEEGILITDAQDFKFNWNEDCKKFADSVEKLVSDKHYMKDIESVINRKSIYTTPNECNEILQKLYEINHDPNILLMKDKTDSMEISFTYKYGEITPSQYTVEIPDDFVFLDEDSTISTSMYNHIMGTDYKDEYKYIQEQVNKFRDIIYFPVKTLCEKEHYESVDGLVSRISDYFISFLFDNNNPLDLTYITVLMYRYFNNDYRFTLEPVSTEMIKSISEVLYEHKDDLDTTRFTKDMKCPHETGESIYEKLKGMLGSGMKTSEYLLSKGIDGMRYDGDTDGRCWVIYNCKDLKIIREEE